MWAYLVRGAALAPLVLTSCVSRTPAPLPVPVSGERAAEPSQPVDAEAPPKTTAAAPAVPQYNARDTARAPEIIRGTGRFTASPAEARQSVSDEAEGITLNFANADIRDVAKAVLGTLLGLNYEIAGNVQGTVTIQTSHPIPREQVLPAFEQALGLNSLALSKSGGLYRITSIEEAQKNLSITPIQAGRGTGEAGYGIEVVPLRYVGVVEMKRLLEPLVPSAGMIQADPVRNLLFIKGSALERAAVLENIALFDVDWLSGMSFSLYSPQYTDARGLARELEQVIGGSSGPLAGVVRFVPIDRLNSILIISPQAKYLEELHSWTERLDRPGEGSDRRMSVYHVQNGRAADLAQVLISAMTGVSAPQSSSAFPSDSSMAQGTPGEPQIQVIDLPITRGSTGKISITADETNNALVIFATPQEFETIKSALRQLDVEPLQVLLEAAIAEVTLTDDLRYGVQFFYQPENRQQFVLSRGNSSTIGAAFPGFSYSFTQGTDIRVVLDALSSITHVEVLSSPQLLVLNNQTATLQVGNQVPIITQQAISTQTAGAPIVNSVQYEDTGVILKVTPRVNRGGLVMMDISQEVSDVAATTTSSINSPTIQQRKISSTVVVQDNETIALGGVFSTSRTKGKSGVPVLQEVPLFGNLFRGTSDKTTKTELLVLITPHVVNNIEKARAVTEELRTKLPSVAPLLKRPR